MTRWIISALVLVAVSGQRAQARGHREHCQEEVSINQLPQAVQNSLTQLAGKNSVDDVCRNVDRDGNQRWTADVMSGDHATNYVFDDTGRIVHQRSHHEHEEH